MEECERKQTNLVTSTENDSASCETTVPDVLVCAFHSEKSILQVPPTALEVSTQLSISTLPQFSAILSGFQTANLNLKRPSDAALVPMCIRQDAHPSNISRVGNILYCILYIFYTSNGTVWQ